MIILKAKKFGDANDVATFVNKNNIKKEDILIITEEPNYNYTIFYYADSEQEEITRGFMGW